MAIKDIPSSNDFRKMGIEHIMIGYDGVLKFLTPLHENDDDYGVTEPEKMDHIQEYWEDARLSLLVHTGLIHEGIDFILKGLISNVSPYLLIKNDPSEIKKKEYFSELLTHDSKALPLLVNTYCESRVDDKFLRMFENSRKRRNKIRHTYDGSLKVQAEDIIKETLQMVNYLLNEKWMNLRCDYYNREAFLTLYQAYDLTARPHLLNEFKVLSKVVTPSEFRAVFHTHKKQRFFLCFLCTHPDYTEEIRTCHLVEEGCFKYLFCLLCSEKFETHEKKCREEDCECNIVVSEYSKCAYCSDYDFQR